MNTHRRYWIGACLVVACVVGSIQIALFGGDETESVESDAEEPRFNVSKDAEDAADCQRRLRKIFQAIQVYRSVKGQLPNWLSDLVIADHIDAKLLVCPYVDRLGLYDMWREGIRGDVFESYKEYAISYSYEFCSKELHLWTGVRKTWGEYKRAQMGLVGDVVPIVRCLAHKPTLNLSIGGDIYESPTVWERLHEGKYSHDDFHPEPLFVHEPPHVDLERLPARPSSASKNLLDLTKFYNAYLDESWMPFSSQNVLVDFEPGVRRLKGFEFDVRGLIQLKGGKVLAPYPVEVNGIPIGRRVQRLHFLHAVHPYPYAEAKVELGAIVAKYKIHFASGGEIEIPIKYGVEVSSWWFDPVFPPSVEATLV